MAGRGADTLGVLVVGRRVDAYRLDVAKRDAVVLALGHQRRYLVTTTAAVVTLAGAAVRIRDCKREETTLTKGRCKWAKR